MYTFYKGFAETHSFTHTFSLKKCFKKIPQVPQYCGVKTKGTAEMPWKTEFTFFLLFSLTLFLCTSTLASYFSSFWTSWNETFIHFRSQPSMCGPCPHIIGGWTVTAPPFELCYRSSKHQTVEKGSKHEHTTDILSYLHDQTPGQLTPAWQQSSDQSSSILKPPET